MRRCGAVQMAGKSESDDQAALCALAMWSDQQVSLRHAAAELSLPGVVQVVSGRYRGIAPAAADTKHHHHHYHSSSRRASSIVFIHSVRTTQKVRPVHTALIL